MKEFELINQLFKPLVKNSVISQDLEGDVAKIILEKDKELVISKDMICEDVHFYRNDGGYKIASKLLRANLSDIASSGAKPLYYMLGFSKTNDQKFIQDFVLGLRDAQKLFDISLIGGDTISLKKDTNPLFFSLTIFGIAKKDKILSRKNAQEDDLIFVSGSIGDAFLGLNLLQKTEFVKQFNFNEERQKYLLDRHYFPTPRIDLGQELIVNNLSKCAIDISDGLLADLNQICRASNLSAEIYLDKVPNFITKKLDYSLAQNLINQGDDYELLFSASEENFEKVMLLQEQLNLKISYIGKIIKKSNCDNLVTIYENQSKSKKLNFSKYGYEH